MWFGWGLPCGRCSATGRCSTRCGRSSSGSIGPLGRPSRHPTSAERARTPGSWSRPSPTVADAAGGFELVASFFTLTGAGFGEEPRYAFAERCRAAAAAGFTGIGVHVDDLARRIASGLDVAGGRAVAAATGPPGIETGVLGRGGPLDADR